MKQVNILQAKQDIISLFAEQNKEPILVKNQTDNYFLILPLEQMNRQEIFFHLYQLPENIFVKQTENQIRYDEIDEICGSMKGLLSSSEDFARNKQNEIDLEEQKWKR